MNRILIVILGLAVNIPGALYAQAESSDYLTITTYYPSPYGVYGTLRLHPRARPSSCREGEIFYDNNTVQSLRGLYYCNSAGDWEPLAGESLWARNETTNNIYNTNSGRSVGIGTTNPRQKGSGTGYLDAKDVWVRDAGGGGAWVSSLSTPRIIGTYETFVEEGSGTYIGCRFAWGAARCSPAGCNSGTTTVLMTGHDKLGAGEFSGWGATEAHVELLGCVQ